MRTILYVFLILTNIFILTGCQSNSVDYTNSNLTSSVKEELGTPQESTDIKELPIENKETITNVQQPIETFLNISDKNSLAVSSNGAHYFYGTTSSNCQGIDVYATNEFGKLMDTYSVQGYSYGDTSFKYGIREDWNNVEIGKNTYKFVARCDNGEEKTASITYIYFPFSNRPYLQKPITLDSVKQELEVTSKTTLDCGKISPSTEIIQLSVNKANEILKQLNNPTISNNQSLKMIDSLIGAYMADTYPECASYFFPNYHYFSKVESPTFDFGSGDNKLSRNGICHSPDSTYYDRTTHYSKFESLTDCLSAGGKLPLN